MSKVLVDGESLYQAANAITDLTSDQSGQSVRDLIQSGLQLDNIYDRIIKGRDGLLDTVSHYGNVSIYDALMNIIYCIILWDEIYVVEERIASHYLDGVKYFEDFGVKFSVFDSRTFEIPRDFYSPLIKNFFERQTVTQDNIGIADQIGDQYYAVSMTGLRALSYFMLANSNDMDYMPSINRQMILESYDFLNYFRRDDVILKLDTDLKNYYVEVNKRMTNGRFRYKFPVLLDFLLEKYSSIEDVIKAAYEIRNQKSAVAFRKELDALTDEFKKGNVSYVDAYYQNIDHILLDLTNTHRIGKTIDVTIGLPPSVTFSFGGNQKNPFQSVFLKDLAYYGIKKRRPPPPLGGRLYGRL